MKSSLTKTIKRSQIRLNPCNPKRHTDEQINLQKKNLRKVGFLGGVVWNERTGNLVDGHRRVKALDIINKYDGSNDYDIKVEAVDFDDKTEKQQLTYMAVGNTKPDYNLIAKYADEIDYSDVGLTQEQYEEILRLRPSVETDAIEDWGGDFLPPVTELDVTEKTSDEIVKEHEEKPKMTAEQVKGEKQYCDDVAAKHHDDVDLYIVVNFRNYEQKLAFCEMLGLDEGRNMILNPEETDKLLDKIN